MGPSICMIPGTDPAARSLFEFPLRTPFNKRPLESDVGIGSLVCCRLSAASALAPFSPASPTDAGWHFTGSVWICVTPAACWVAITLISRAYVLIGSTYLDLKTSGELQRPTSHPPVLARCHCHHLWWGPADHRFTAPFSCRSRYGERTVSDPSLFSAFFVVLPSWLLP